LILKLVVFGTRCFVPQYYQKIPPPRQQKAEINLERMEIIRVGNPEPFLKPHKGVSKNPKPLLKKTSAHLANGSWKLTELEIWNPKKEH
jgi:hypothetical protein